MKTRTIISILSICGATIIPDGIIEAQQNGVFGRRKADSGLYQGVDTKIKIASKLRKGNEDAGEPAYSSYPYNPEPVSMIPPPPIEEVMPDIVIPEPVSMPEIVPPPVVKKELPPPPKPKKKVAVIKEIPPAPKPASKPVAPIEIRQAKPLKPVAKISRRPAPVQPVQMAKPVEAPMVYRPAVPAATVVEAVPRQPESFGYQQNDVEPPISQARPVAPSVQASIVHKPDCPYHENNPSRTGLNNLRKEANILAEQGIPYRFGRSHPAFGGLDSAGAVQYLLNEVGVPAVPRTTGGQSNWVRVNHLLREFQDRPSAYDVAASLVPGNLIFWGEPFNGRLSHVMIYLGYDAERGQHLAFGTRGGSEVGINGNEVDIFPLKLDKEKIVSTGQIPGLRNL